MWFGGLLDAAFILQCINSPPEPFVDWEPLNQNIDIHAHKVLRSADFKAQNCEIFGRVRWREWKRKKKRKKWANKRKKTSFCLLTEFRRIPASKRMLSFCTASITSVHKMKSLPDQFPFYVGRASWMMRAAFLRLARLQLNMLRVLQAAAAANFHIPRLPN